MLSAIKGWALRRIPTAWAGRLRAWRVRRLIRRYPTRVVEHSYGGTRLKVFLADPLSQGWYDHDWSDLPEIAALQHSRLRPGARVFDIGAHQGVVAAMLARVVGPSGQVVAVEASPHNCAAALRNRELNGLPQIEVVQAAVSNHPGTVVFNEGLNGQLDDGSGESGRISVEAVTIDALADRFGPPDVVFLDVEGAESLALSGASSVLASGADFFVEVHVGCGLEKLGGSVTSIRSFFPEDRFTVVARAEADAAFRPLRDDDPLMSDRFFLLASLWTMPLETARLRLLLSSPRHLLTLIDQPAHFERLSGFPAADGLREFFRSDDVSPAWLEALRSSDAADPWRHGFFVVHRESGAAIGSAGFKGPPEPDGSVEIAYGIVPAFQGRGYATEAAAALIDFARADDRVRLVRAHTLTEPNASTGVLLRCGFRQTGTFVDPEDGPVWRWERHLDSSEE